jgi:hypothetical protein
MAWGPRPSDTLDFAQVKRPPEATEPPWAIEEDRPRTQRALAAKGGQDLAIILFIILAAVAIGGSVLMWIFQIPPFR